MKFELEENAKRYLTALLKKNEDNSYASFLLNEYLLLDHSRDKEVMESYGGFSLNSLLAIFEGSINSEEEEYIRFVRENPDYFSFKKIDEKIYEKNPYYILLRNASSSYKGVHLGKRAYAPYEGFLEDEIHAEKENLYQEISPFGYFLHGFFAPALEKKGRIWMSLIPHEIHTMKKDIEQAEGDVLTFGLGLGYYAFMVSQKEEVKRVTIIEKDRSIIDLFKKELLPLFPKKEKIRIIEEDAFSFLKKEDCSRYDHCFVDLWHNEEDGLPIYLSFKKEEAKKKLSFSYWIEGSILVYLRRYVFALIQEELDGKEDGDYPEGDFVDNLFRKLHFLLKEKTLRKKEDIDDLLEERNLKGIAPLLG